MSTRFILRMAAPMVGLSLLLLAVGVVAAWYIHSQQKANSELLARDVSSMLTAEDLEISVREIRNRLNRYLRNNDRSYLEEISALRTRTLELLDRAKRLSDSPAQEELVSRLQSGCQHFLDQVGRLTSDPEHGELAPVLFDDLTQDEIFTPAREYVEYHRQNVERSSEQSQRSANLMGLAMLMLGVCGSVAGLLAGLGIARGVSRSIVQLSVPVHGVAGKLNELVGPITVSTGGGFKELESALRGMADQVATVVERLEQRELEVLRAEQLAAVGQLAAGIAHEVRNPLMAMKILVQAAAEQGDDGSLRGRDLIVVDEEITRLEQSIQALLDFARPPQLAKATVDVRSLVSHTVDLARARAQRQRAQVCCEFPDRPVEVEADSGQIRQVLLNLLFNALDSLSAGGEIGVRVEADEALSAVPRAGEYEGAMPGLLSNRGPADGQRGCAIHVTDTGPGLPAGLGERIFEPFVSTKETGTGLGLPICRRIVEAHGGRIAALNRPEGGAEFVVWLPRATVAFVASPGRPAPASAASPTGVA